MRVLYTALVLLITAPVFIPAAEIVLMEEIVAKINGEIITSTELKESRRLLEEELKQRGLTGAQLEQALKEGTGDLLRDRIDAILMIQKGKDLNLKVEPDVNRRIADYQRQFKMPDPEEFQRYVAQQTGHPYEDFRSRIQDEILMDQVRRNDIYTKIQVPAVEKREFYDAHLDQFQREERVFLRELLVSTEGKTAKEDLDAAEAKAKDLSRRGKNGEAFAPMVQNNSDNLATKELGGLLDPFTKRNLAAALEFLWDQPPGFVSDPIRFANGWEIFKVEDHQRAGLAGYAEVEQEIENRLFGEKAIPATRAYLSQLRTQAFLQIKAGYVDSAAAPGKDTSWADVLTLRPETVEAETVLQNPSMKRLLGVFPIPGTEKTGASSSR
jgi:parvulin-like peptidyl-prolyl isomerase